MATPRKPDAKRGRPGTYNAGYHPGEAYRLTLLGLTDEQLAGVFQVHRATIERWKARFPEFCDSVTRGKLTADGRVVEALYQRALGYTHLSEEIFCTKAGKIVRARTTKRYAPDVKALGMWLFNRQAERWRNRVEVTHNERLPFSDLPEAELDRRLGLRPAGDEAGELSEKVPGEPGQIH